jgi:hypothetical protein
MYRAFPGSKYYGGSAPSWTDRRSMRPADAPRLDARNTGETRTVPVFTVIRSMKEEPDSVPAASPRLPRSTSPWSPGQSSKPTQEFPTKPLNMLGRTALGPYPPGSSRSSLERRKRRFLAYSFPSRSPDPHHLAVLTRSDFVGAARHPHRHHPDRTAPSFTALLRQDRQRRSHTPSRIHSTSRRTQRRLKIDPFTTVEN